MEEEIYKKIETYLGGDMSSDEVKEFELRMSKDINIQKEVKLANEINHHLNDESWLPAKGFKDRKIRQDLEDYIKSAEANEVKSKLLKANQRYKRPKTTLKSKSWLVAIAAVFIIGLCTTVYFNQNPSKDLYAQYYAEKDLPSLVKRGAENELMNNGIVAFKAKEYEKAISFFEDYEEKTKDPLLYSYIGFSHLELHNINEALVNFDKLLNSNSLDKSRALWYKSLVYLKMDQSDELMKLLLEITNDSTNFNYKKAKKLLVDLDK